MVNTFFLELFVSANIDNSLYFYKFFHNFYQKKHAVEWLHAKMILFF